MPRYVDGFVLPIPKKNADRYRAVARKFGKIWREHGALEYCECIADDVKPGKHTSFPMSVKLEPGEAVWFSWITFKSRKHRDRVNAAVMKDPRVVEFAAHDPKLFDAKRMIYGGFAMRVDL
jgi:uncharacterized protein YbaA (DUF1428 family)